MTPSPAEQAQGRETVQPHAPAAGSRLLRALAGKRGAGDVRPDGGAPEAARPGTLRVYAAESCPRALLRRLLAGAADDAGALTALGIEREVLTLCRERQEVVAGLFETEARLRELHAAADVPAPGTPDTATRTSAPAMRESVAARPSQPSPLRAALAGAERPQEKGTLAPRYGWFSIIGTAGALRAGVTDGTGVWFVSEGDALPGGGTVAAIAGRPPAVRVTTPDGSGEETALSWRMPPGGTP